MKSLAVAGAAMILVAVVSPAPARAASAGYCPDGNGVTVVIDFQELGGGTIIRCAPGDQALGLSALRNAGIGFEGTARWGEAFICRIEGKPGPADEPCIDTPPATAYWSYWHAPNGGNWTYSDKGLMARKPPLGSFEGWSFAKNKTSGSVPPPGVAPRRPAQPPPPPPQQPPPPPQQPDSPPPPVPTSPGSSGAPPAATPTSPAVTPVSVTTSPSGLDVAEPPITRTSQGIPIMTLAGIGIVVVLLAAAGYITYRRRRSTDVQ